MITVPTRILVGADDTIATPTAIADALHRTERDDITLTTIDAEDHHLALHRPELVADAVTDLGTPARTS